MDNNNITLDYRKVTNRTDFLKFIKKLELDFVTNTDEWENIRIDHYLESIGAWVDSMELTKEYDDKFWGILARVLYVGKIYE